MSSQVEHASYQGQPSNGVWTQVESFVVTNKHQPDVSSYLHIILVVNNQTQLVNLSSYCQSVYLRFKSLAQSYDNNRSSAFIESLTHLVSEIVQDSKDLGLELLVAYQFGWELFVAGVGGVTATMVRNQELGKILDASHSVVVVNGQLKPGDMVFLATSRLHQQISYVRLKRLLVERLGVFNTDSIVSELAVSLKRAPSDAGVGTILIRAIEASSNIPSKKKFWPGLLNWQPRQRIFMKRKIEDRKRQRFSMVIVLGLLSLLGLSLTFGWYRRLQIEAAQALAAAKQPLESLMSEAIVEQQLNPLKARSLLQQARDQSSQTLNMFEPDSESRKEIETLVSQIEALYQQVAAEYTADLSIYMDLNLIEPGFVGEKLGLADDRLIVLDTSQDRLLTLGTINKDPSRIIQTTDLANASLVAGVLDEVFAFSPNGVVSVDTEDVSSKVIIETDPDWEQVVGFGAYADNIYILDSSQGEIWRYRGVAGEEFVRQRWLAPGVNPDFAEVVDMVIDGDIWITDQTGLVRRYSRGVGQNVELLGLEEELQVKALGINTEEVFIFDQHHNRVLVFDHTGNYLKQYRWHQTELVTDMVVSDKTIFLLAGSIIFTLSL